MSDANRVSRAPDERAQRPHKRAKAAHGNAERVLAIQALELLETRWGQ